MSDVGFKYYTYQGMSIHPDDAKIMGKVQAQEMYFLNTDNFKLVQKPAKRTTVRSVIREAIDRLKLAYCALKYGQSYFD